MAILDGYAMEPMVGDPDDHRPNTRWAILVDPGSDAGRVDTLGALTETIAPGDRIPLHTHSVDELVLYRSGTARVTLGHREERVGEGVVVYIPAGTRHGTLNDGTESVRLFAVYPGTRIDITYLDRNPAPGTEGDAPQPPLSIDLRSGVVEPT
jgi:quercetin dioxygenase-like cupin family protein